MELLLLIMMALIIFTSIYVVELDNGNRNE